MWNGCWRSEVYNSFWRVAPSPALSQRWRNAVENLSSFPHKKREGGSLLWAFFTWTEGSEPACRAGADGNGCASTVFRDAHAAPRGSRAAAAAWSLGPLKSMAVINTCFWAPPGTRANFDSLCTFPSPVPRGGRPFYTILEKENEVQRSRYPAPPTYVVWWLVLCVNLDRPYAQWYP